jgi:RNAse (barnase) inhibitor barstar
MASKSKSGSRDTTTMSSAWIKSDVITVRLNPKLKYGLELLSRKQHRNISSLVTWAIEQAINDPQDGLHKKMSKGLKIAEPKQMLDVLWDVDPADQLVKIATHWPELMTYDEEKLIKAFKEVGSWPKKGDSATESMQKMWPDMMIDPGDGSYHWCG